MTPHATSEQLSAHVDGRVEADDARRIADHLPKCERCSGELAELGAMRGLLRGMPAVAPPRSFVLSAPMLAAAKSGARAAPATRGRILQFPRSVLASRVASTVAATFFVLFFTADMAGLGNARPIPPATMSQGAIRTSTAAPAGNSGGSGSGQQDSAGPQAPLAPISTSAGTDRRAAEPAKPAAAAKPALGAQAAGSPASVDRSVAPLPRVAAPADVPPASGAPSSAQQEAAAPSSAPAPRAAFQPPASSASQPPASSAGAAAEQSAAAKATPLLPPSRPPADSASGAATSVTAAKGPDASGAQESAATAPREREVRLESMARTVDRLAGSPSPLRWSWIGTGVLTVVLLVLSFVLGRRLAR